LLLNAELVTIIDKKKLSKFF